MGHNVLGCKDRWYFGAVFWCGIHIKIQRKLKREELSAKTVYTSAPNKAPKLELCSDLTINIEKLVKYLKFIST